MKALRFIIALAALLFVWLVVSVGVGLLIGIIFQPKGGAHFLVFWLDWHALPGLAIGLVMGVRAFRAIAGNTKKRTDDTNANHQRIGKDRGAEGQSPVLNAPPRLSRRDGT